MSTPDKAAVVAGLQAQIQSELESLESLAAMARDALAGIALAP